MIKYFNEINSLDQYYLKLIDYNSSKNRKLYNNSLPDDYYIKNMHLFITIDEMDLLYDNKFGKTALIDNKVFDYKFDDFFSNYVNEKNHFNYKKYGMTEEGIRRLEFLINDFNDNYNKPKYCYEYYIEFEEYMKSIVYLFYLDREILNRTNNRELLNLYLNKVLIVAEYQEKLCSSVKNDIESSINEIDKYNFEIPLDEYESIDYKLPNCWYITPFNHLYNAMGTDTHKEANLAYPYYYHYLQFGINPNYKIFLHYIDEIRKNKYIDKDQFKEYLNLIYDFPCVYPKEYYDLSGDSKDDYDNHKKRSHDKDLINIVTGIISAHAGLYMFLNELDSCTDSYDKNITYLLGMDLDEILIRCCGFHKISSVVDKTITTSSLNYKKEFSKYIENGWKIDFVLPIVFNENKELNEYDNTVKIRQLKRY